MLQSRDEAKCESNKKNRSSHYFNTFFFDKLFRNGYNYDNVRRWTKKFNTFSKDKIFIPINIDNVHWTLIVVYIQLKRIHYYDSMSGSGMDRLNIILQWLKDESIEKYDNQYIIDDDEWQLIDREDNVPQQSNRYDDGIFLI